MGDVKFEDVGDEGAAAHCGAVVSGYFSEGICDFFRDADAEGDFFFVGWFGHIKRCDGFRLRCLVWSNGRLSGSVKLNLNKIMLVRPIKKLQMNINSSFVF